MAALVGRQVRKLFADGEWYEGTIDKYKPETNWWHVTYEDGDHEDLEEEEVNDVLLPAGEEDDAPREPSQERHRKKARKGDKPALRGNAPARGGTSAGNAAAATARASSGKAAAASGRPQRTSRAAARTRVRRAAADDSDCPDVVSDDSEAEEAPLASTRPRRSVARTRYAGASDDDERELTEESDESGPEDDGEETEPSGSESSDSSDDEEEEEEGAAPPTRLPRAPRAARASTPVPLAHAAARAPPAKRARTMPPPPPADGGDEDLLDAPFDGYDTLRGGTPPPPQLPADKKKAAAAGGGAAKGKGKAAKGKAAAKPKGGGGKGRKARDASAPLPIDMMEDDKECTFENVDRTLWESGAISAPAVLPTEMFVLETFAGCGGFHIAGSATFGDIKLSLRTLAAVEIENEPARTYAANHSGVNVLHMGVGRFLGTARRLWALKTLDSSVLEPAGEPAGGSDAPAAELVVTDVFVDFETASVPGPGVDSKGRTIQRQDKDHMTVEASQGKRALHWLRFRVFTKGGPPGEAPQHMADADEGPLRRAVHAYLNSDAFGPHKFPLPGDIQVVTGGPPCQGWSGYNTTRISSEDLGLLMTHPENRLLGRFLEVVWFFKPLYVVMEEVPAVASKKEVMTWMNMVLDSKGYAMKYHPRIITGRFGVPQTRERLIVIAALKSLTLPEFPQPVTAPQEEEQAAVQWAFEESDAAFPITVRCRADGSAAAAEARRRSEADRKLAELEAAGCMGPVAPPGAKAVEAALASAAPPPKKAKAKAKAAGTLSAAGASTSTAAVAKPTLRHLVLGDSLSCDLPVECHVVNGSGNAEDMRHSYLCEPPTSYIAYLRKSTPAGGVVHNHSVFKLNASDTLRIDAVPFRTDASWRDLMGPLGNMHDPQMFELTEAEWDNVNSRYWNTFPSYMLARPRQRGERMVRDDEEMPPLLHGWRLAPMRFPVVPFWCITMKHGQDRGCYGRLSLTEPHLTVHSYNKPHWHVSLLPWGNRVLTVRDKARVQGFADSFHFCGSIQSQYKQIANAVSPQLAIAIGRELLVAHAHSLPRPGAGGDSTTPQPPLPAPVFSAGLQDFADFLETFDERTLLRPEVKRLKPAVTEKRAMSSMTYEEFLVCYNTDDRHDHSTRYENKTPFEVLRRTEDFHPWHADEIVGIRRRKERGPKGEVVFELGILYPGFDAPEWVQEDIKEYKGLWSYQKFHDLYGPAIERVRTGRAPYFVTSPSVDPKAVSVESPVLIAARERFHEFEARYEEEKAKGWIRKTKESAKRQGAMRKQPVAAAEDDEEGGGCDDATMEDAAYGEEAAPYVDSDVDADGTADDDE